MTYHLIMSEMVNFNVRGTQFNIPVNTRAVVYFPVLPKAELSEENHASFTNAGMENGKTKVTVGSGYYKFNLKYK